jgi:Condensation domain
LTVADRLSALTPEQRALFEALRRRQRESQARPLHPPPVHRVTGPDAAGDWPLSIDQERLWRMHRDRPGLISWNVDAASRMKGDLDVPALDTALREVVRRHAALRATFPVVDGRPVQRVRERGEAGFSLIDVSALPAERRETEGRRAMFDRTRAVFDLERGPLIWAVLVRLAAGDHFWLLTVHHTATDWITFQIIFQELMALYEAARAGAPSPFPEPSLQFPDYAVWEREWWSGEMLEEYAGFWRRELAGFPLTLDLPGDRPRPPVQSQRGGMVHFISGPGPAHRLRALARKEGATTFMALLAVLDSLLFRLTGREKIVVGSNSANRPRPELEPVVGLFLTQVPFAVDLAGDPTFREVLARARKAALSAYTHQNMPFDKLVEVLAPDAGPQQNPVVQVLLLVLAGHSHARGEGLESEPTPLFDGNSRWDLMFGLYDFDDLGFSGPVEYNADLFDRATVEGWLVLFRLILDRVVADPDVRLSMLPALEEVAT